MDSFEIFFGYITNNISKQRGCVKLIDIARIKDEAIRSYRSRLEDGCGEYVPEAEAYGVRREVIVQQVLMALHIKNLTMLGLRFHNLEIPMWKSTSTISKQLRDPDKVFLRYGPHNLDALLVLKENAKKFH